MSTWLSRLNRNILSIDGLIFIYSVTITSEMWNFFNNSDLRPAPSISLENGQLN